MYLVVNLKFQFRTSVNNYKFLSGCFAVYFRHSHWIFPQYNVINYGRVRSTYTFSVLYIYIFLLLLFVLWTSAGFNVVDIHDARIKKKMGYTQSPGVCVCVCLQQRYRRTVCYTTTLIRPWMLVSIRDAILSKEKDTKKNEQNGKRARHNSEMQI